MIENEREYRITQSRLAKFREAMNYLAGARVKQTLDLQEAATKSMIQTLKDELKKYIQLKTENIR